MKRWCFYTLKLPERALISVAKSIPSRDLDLQACNRFSASGGKKPRQFAECQRENIKLAKAERGEKAVIINKAKQKHAGPSNFQRASRLIWRDGKQRGNRGEVWGRLRSDEFAVRRHFKEMLYNLFTRDIKKENKETRRDVCARRRARQRVRAVM